MKELTSQQFLNQSQLLIRSKLIIDEIPQSNLAERLVYIVKLRLSPVQVQTRSLYLFLFSTKKIR